MIRERAQINAVSWAEVGVIKIEKNPNGRLFKIKPHHNLQNIFSRSSNYNNLVKSSLSLSQIKSSSLLRIQILEQKLSIISLSVLRQPVTMANENEKKKLNEEEDDEPKIPVFTVLKNGAILKNIFIVNKPPPPPTNKPISSVHQQTQEEILIVGRHPDCNIVLTHPSISRFHLQILSSPSSQQLSLTDLSSGSFLFLISCFFQWFF